MTMKKSFVRFVALTMMLALMIGMLPLPAAAVSSDKQQADAPKSVYVYTEEDNAAIDRDVFAKIETVKTKAANKLGGISQMTEQDYIDLVPQVIDTVKNSETYVPGTLQQNGNFLVWETTIGIPCCYDPRMEAELHNTENDPTPEEIAKAEAAAQAMLEEIYPVKGGPNSMNIGLIQPYWESSSNYADSSFNSYSPQYKALWQSLYETTGGEGLRYAMSTATVDNIAHAMSECGFVMFDSHGTTDYSSGGDYTSRANCSYLCLTTSTGITSADTEPQQGEFGTYYHCIRSGSGAYVSGTCIANHMTDYAPNSYLYMGICLGMATDGMEAGLRDKGVEAVYGYSQSVSFVGDMAYMSAVNGALKNGDDLATAVSAAKESVGPWDYYSSHPTIESARNDDCAFPIVVSSEDPYPGHGNVDDLQDVYSSWSLFGTNYEVSAVSNNTEWGTVSVRGSSITAEPAEGFYAAGYTVLEGDATVTQNGNKFVVKASSNCTVQINFAAKTPATVTYVANGSVYSTAPGYVGDPVTLPTTAPEVEGWTFKAWVLDAIEETVEKPAFLKPGAAFTPEADTVIYALYYRVEGTSGGEVIYELVSDDPGDWNGNYVITYGTDSNMYLLKGVTPTSNGMHIEIAANAGKFSDSGATLDDETLAEVPDQFVFAMEDHGNYYSVQNVSTEAYLGVEGSFFAVYTAYTSGKCDWTPGVGENFSSMELANGGSYPYLSFSTSSNYFWIYTSPNTSVRLWKEAESGTKIYSTNPGNIVHEHNMQHVEAVAPTCGNAGNTEYYRCIVCGKYFSDEAGEHEITQQSTVLAATGNHSYGDWTSNNNGTHTRNCSVCGNGESQACAYDYAVTIPTCTEDGYTTYICTVCDYSYQGNPVAALGHDWSDWTQTVAPTCTQQGEKQHTCSRCNTVETESVAALGHDYDAVVTEPTCTEGGYTTHTCSRCSDSYTDSATDPLGHNYGEWTVTTAPTCTEPGQETRTCSRCQNAETRTVDALGHLWDNGVVTVVPTTESEGEMLYTCARCGETHTEVIPVLQYANPFVDVAYGRYYYDAVIWAYYHAPQVTGGTDETHFSPKAPCTREQFVFFLWAASGKPEPAATSTSFTDVKENKYYFKAVLWAQENGITGGISETCFGVGQYCSREQIVTFLWRAAESPEPETVTNPFSDVPARAYYAKAVRWAVENAVTGGTGKDTFSPKKLCTRAEVITFLYRYEMLNVHYEPPIVCSVNS